MLFQVDGRRSGTSGKRKAFGTLSEAEKHAGELASLLTKKGEDALSFVATKADEVTYATNLLAPYERTTITKAVEFYVEHLSERKLRNDSATIPTLAAEWYEEKASGKYRKLRQATLDSIEQAAKWLKESFAEKRLLQVTTTDIETYLDKEGLSLRTKHNIKSLFSQFFNWAKAKGKGGARFVNPCDAITFNIEDRDVSIFTPQRAKDLIAVCETKFPQYVLFHVIGLFAGLRPDECRLLKWEQINMDERTITVLKDTSKVKDTRNVPIEDVLYAFLLAV